MAHLLAARNIPLRPGPLARTGLPDGGRGQDDDADRERPSSHGVLRLKIGSGDGPGLLYPGPARATMPDT